MHISAEVLVDAMARHTLELKARGVSPRTLSGVYTDLDAAGMLVFMYDAPRAKKVLSHFYGAPWESEFKRKFTDRPNLVVRYRKNLEAFSRFLQEAGMIPTDGD